MNNTFEKRLSEQHKLFDILRANADVGKFFYDYSVKCPIERGVLERVGDSSIDKYNSTIFSAKVSGMNEKTYSVKKFSFPLFSEEVKVQNEYVPYEEILKTVSSSHDIPFSILKMINDAVFRKRSPFETKGFLFRETIARVFIPEGFSSKVDKTFFTGGSGECEIKKEVTIPRNDENGYITFQPGDYMCRSGVFTETMLNMLMGEYYHQGKCINLIGVYGFGMCSYGKFLDYYNFQEETSGMLLDSIWSKETLNLEKILCIMFQLFFVSAFLHRKGIIHNDLNFDNVYFEKLDENSLYNGKKIGQVEYLQYRIGKTKFFIPNYGVIVKVGDYSIASKLSGYGSKIGNMKYLVEKQSWWRPNWMTHTFDDLTVLGNFLKNIPSSYDAVHRIFNEMTQGKLKDAVSKCGGSFDSVFNTKIGIPKKELTVAFDRQLPEYKTYNFLLKSKIFKVFRGESLDDKSEIVGVLN